MTVTQEPRIGPPGGVAQRYARAFYDYVSERGETTSVLEQVHALREAIAQNGDLRFFLSDPRLSVRQAGKAATALAEKLGLADSLKRLLGVLAENRRLSHLAAVLAGVEALEARRRGETRVEICTASPLTEEQRSALRAQLAASGHDHVSMIERLDPALIGGMTVRVGSVLFDTSIAGRLARLQNAMKGVA